MLVRGECWSGVVSVLARGGAAALATVLTAGLVVASQAPWRANPEDVACIRLSWRSVSEPVSECRVPSPEELEALPVHMRMQEICERRHAPFRLVVQVDGAAVRDVTLVPAGASGDRPLYVFEELRVAPGPHRLVIRFDEERSPERPAAAPLRSLALDASLQLTSREVALVTLDASGERLAVATTAR